MATNFPTSLDSLTNPGPTDSMAVVSHSAQHINANDAIEALEAKVGIDGSAVATSHDYKIAALVTDLSSHVAAADPHTGYVLESNVNDTVEAAIANAPTGTGSVVLSASPTFTGTVGAAAITATSLVLPDGSASAPTILFNNGGDPTYGIFSYGGGPAVTQGGTARHIIVSSNVRVSSTVTRGWSSTTSATAASDTGISRTAAATLAIGNGTQGNASGTLQLATLTAGTAVGIGGATIGSNALAVSGTAAISGLLSCNSLSGPASVVLTSTGYIGWLSRAWMYATGDGVFSLRNNSEAATTALTVAAGGLTIAPSGGATSITGTLAVSSETTIGGRLRVTGSEIAWDASSFVRTRALSNGILTMWNSSESSFSGLNLGYDGNATAVNLRQKAVASIADNTATAVFTVTIPNAAHSASIRVRLVGSSGAGGAVGANESTQEAEYLINICRTAGVNAVFDISTVRQPPAVTVAGGNAVAVSAGVSAVSGAVGATNTFSVQVTIARAGGSATNHTCLAFAELLNANSSGVTIS